MATSSPTTGVLDVFHAVEALLNTRGLLSRMQAQAYGPMVSVCHQGHPVVTVTLKDGEFYLIRSDRPALTAVTLDGALGIVEGSVMDVVNGVELVDCPSCRLLAHPSDITDDLSCSNPNCIPMRTKCRCGCGCKAWNSNATSDYCNACRLYGCEGAVY